MVVESLYNMRNVTFFFFFPMYHDNNIYNKVYSSLTRVGPGPISFETCV